MRPDRMASGLSFFVKEKMGAFFTSNIHLASTKFTLKPAAQKVGLESGISKDNNKFENISMGQGQDKRAT